MQSKGWVSEEYYFSQCPGCKLGVSKDDLGPIDATQTLCPSNKQIQSCKMIDKACKDAAALLKNLLESFIEPGARKGGIQP